MPASSSQPTTPIMTTTKSNLRSSRSSRSGRAHVVTVVGGVVMGRSRSRPCRRWPPLPAVAPRFFFFIFRFRTVHSNGQSAPVPAVAPEELGVVRVDVESVPSPHAETDDAIPLHGRYLAVIWEVTEDAMCTASRRVASHVGSASRRKAARTVRSFDDAHRRHADHRRRRPSPELTISPEETSDGRRRRRDHIRVCVRDYSHVNRELEQEDRVMTVIWPLHERYMTVT